MAGNLMSPRFANRLPINMLAVQQVQDKAENLLAQSKDTQSQIFMDRISELTALKSAIQTTERQFYETLNLSNKTDEQAIKELQSRIDKINSSTGLLNLVSNNKYKILADLSPYLSQLTSATLLTTLQDPEITSLIVQNVGKQVIQDTKTYIDALNKILDNASLASNIPTGKFLSTSGGVGLSRYIEVIVPTKQNIKPSDIVVNIKGNLNDVHLSTTIKSKLNAAISYLQNKPVTVSSSKLTTREKQQLLYNTILPYLDTSIHQYLHYELFNNFNYYDVYLNESSLKGFFGELQANLVLDLLYAGERKNDGAQNFERIGLALPTGNIKTLIEGQSINIDSIINGFGFQIKNYQLNNDGSIEFSGRNQAGNFIDQRARVSKGADILVDLFASYQFNQVFKEIDAERAQTIYAPIYAQFDSIISNTQPLFQAYIDNIIRVSAEFQARLNDHALFKTNDIYFNTFFLINGRLVPSSLIIEAIIDSLVEAQNRDIISFEITNYKTTPNETLENIIINSGHKTTHYISGKGLDVNRYANLVSINYDVKLNLDKVLQLAASKLR